MREIIYHECNGLQDKCPYEMKIPLFNSLITEKPCNYGDVYIGSLDCQRCKFFDGAGKYVHKSGTSWYFSIICNYENRN